MLKPVDSELTRLQALAKLKGYRVVGASVTWPNKRKTTHISLTLEPSPARFYRHGRLQNPRGLGPTGTLYGRNYDAVADALAALPHGDTLRGDGGKV